MLASTSAAVTGDLLDTLSAMSLETPALVSQDRSGNGQFDLAEFKAANNPYFNDSVNAATAVSVRAIGSQSMTDPTERYASIAENVTCSQAPLKRWQGLNHAQAEDGLDILIPDLTNAYGRIMFERSGGSGSFAGELVN